MSKVSIELKTGSKNAKRMKRLWTIFAFSDSRLINNQFGKQTFYPGNGNSSSVLPQIKNTPRVREEEEEKSNSEHSVKLRMTMQDFYSVPELSETDRQTPFEAQN